MAPGNIKAQPPRSKDDLQENIRVDNSMSTNLKVKQVQAPDVPQVERKMEDDFQGEMEGFDDLYATDMGGDFIINDEMIEAVHPNPRFDRENEKDEEDDQGLTQTVQFGSLPRVVVNNYILPISL